MKSLIFLFITLAIIPFTFGNTENSSETDLKKMFHLYKKSAEKENYLEKALEHAEKAGEIDPFYLEGFSATFYLLKAKYAGWPPKKWEYAQKGIGILDSLVKKEPESMQIRYLRASSNYFLPFFFNRKTIVKEDIQFLYTAITTSDNPISLWEQEAVYFLVKHGDLNNQQQEKLGNISLQKDPDFENSK